MADDVEDSQQSGTTTPSQFRTGKSGQDRMQTWTEGSGSGDVHRSGRKAEYMAGICAVSRSPGSGRANQLV